MRHSWNEYRSRAASFAEEWADAHYEKGDTQTFYNEFFAIFDIRRRSVARYEEHVQKLGDTMGYIDLLWPGVLLVEQKSAGGNLDKARVQAKGYFDALKEYEKPRYILLCDFQRFELLDLDEEEEWFFTLSQLADNIERFAFIMGVQRHKFKDQDPVNIAASELAGEVHDLLEYGGYKGHDLERFLVRLVFCFFAEDTRIFEHDLFLDFLEERTAENGSDLGEKLLHLFQILNTKEELRSPDLDETLAKFPYVNGELFAESLQIPTTTKPIRDSIISACKFNWTNVSPAIFGALFQSVMDPEQRREQGAHYTTEHNILKIIGPLFMDDLRSEFEKLKSRRDNRRKAALRKFHSRISKLRFFDPACGCGNFLIIAYCELRQLEIEVLQEIHKGQYLDVSIISLIDVDQFYGIELLEFPARIAETAMWMMDHIMNSRLSSTFGKTYARIPLKKAPHIHNEDALERDWAEILPPEQCDYVLGNPPFGGAKLQSKEQRAQIRRIAALGGSGGTLDYVAAWYIKAAQYIQKGNGKIGFVATNSICQGEQVAQLWPLLLDKYGLEITFAHRTFKWGSEARGKAQVYVILLGLSRLEAAPPYRRLFSYENPRSESPTEIQIGTITPYLADGSKFATPYITVEESPRPINELPEMVMGSQLIDNGHYIFTDDERREFLKQEPDAEPFIRPFIGAQEFLHNEDRFILYLGEASLDELARLPKVKERMALVSEYRQKSKRAGTRKLAETPTKYQLNVIPDKPFLVFPGVSSEGREYMPIGWLEPPVIPSNAMLVALDASKSDFAFLTSTMHMAWLRYVGGRLESRYRYSAGLVYNTFPMPETDAQQLRALEPLAHAILDERKKHPSATLANLYTSDLLSQDLLRAHQKLDRAVDKLYRRKKFNSESERISLLLEMYEKRINALNLSPDRPKPQRRRRRINPRN
ncbi:MAG: N-6 DNA methylase [Alphaproteobacteria bacterium]